MKMAYYYLLSAKALKYVCLFYSHPVLIPWKNTMSSSKYSSGKLDGKWSKGSKVTRDGQIEKQHGFKIRTVLGNQKRNNWETKKTTSSCCYEENSTYRVIMNWSTDLLQLKQYTEFLDASVISTFSRNQPLSVERRRKDKFDITKTHIKHKECFWFHFQTLCGSALSNGLNINNKTEKSIIQIITNFFQILRRSLMFLTGNIKEKNYYSLTYISTLNGTGIRQMKQSAL